MVRNIENTVLLSLATTLVGTQVESDVILHALELICKAGEFDCGTVYELNRSNQFCRMELYSARPVAFPSCFSANGARLRDHPDWPHPEIYYFSRSAPGSLWGAPLSELFPVESLILAPMADQTGYTHGFVLLADFSLKPEPTGESRQVLAAALYLLLRYVQGRMYQQKISHSQTTLESILNNTGIDVYVNDFDTHDILYVNRSMAAPYGGPEAFAGRKCWEVLFPGQSGPCTFCPKEKLVDLNGIPARVYSWDYQRPFDGTWFRVFSAAFYWDDGRLVHIVSSADITENKHNEAVIENLANYDQLTGLPNRRMLLKECERRINRATATEQGYLLFFDIDGFKSVNDEFGHDSGDEFLIQLGEFFSEIPLLRDSIYRNGGDEFVAIVGGESITKSHIQSLANFIHTRFQRPWKLRNGEVFCSTSIGVACYPEDGSTGEVLLQKADKAMYLAKNSGGGRLCFGYQLEPRTAQPSE